MIYRLTSLTVFTLEDSKSLTKNLSVTYLLGDVNPNVYTHINSYLLNG